ncbi:hypothetical protein TrVE_jg5730 [Triparma verrucosa]|uniref:RING-type domain-containing protein n=1 Tax=Triparma verrucosa TaxID=1606542 RepID=A0A9W6ZC93_9STRA|nr:hypothetical protein TrVE_jg5730 [Triparma verrucosa]
MATGAPSDVFVPPPPTFQQAVSTDLGGPELLDLCKLASERPPIGDVGGFDRDGFPTDVHNPLGGPTVSSTFLPRSWDIILQRARALEDRRFRGELFKADEDGMTVLNFALCWNGPIALVELILSKCRTKAPKHTNEAGEHILQMRSAAGWLPLHLAAATCLDLNVIKVVIRHYPEALRDSCTAGTPIDLAKSMGTDRSNNAEIIELLENCRACFENQDPVGLLQHCAIEDLLSLTKKFDWPACIKRVRWSLMNPAIRFMDEILKTDASGWTPLAHAIKWQGPSDLITLILHKCESDIDKKRLLSMKDNMGHQALHLAAAHYDDIVIIRSFIVDYPIALQVTSDDGRTPLDLAKGTNSQRATHAEIVSLVDCCTSAKDEYEVKKLCGAIDPTYAHLRDSLQAAVTCRDCDKIDESIALLEAIRLGGDPLVGEAKVLAEELRPQQAFKKLQRQVSEKNRALNDLTDKLDATVCVVCMVNQRSTVIMECAHLVCCPTCANKLTSCPICRGKISRKINTKG